MRGRRKCVDCSQPLGGTVIRCHSCGGKNRAEPPLTETSYNNAYFWKVWLMGIPRDQVKAVHDEARSRDPRYNDSEGEWEHNL